MSSEKLESFFDGLNKDQFKNLLIEAGFEVEDGEGKIVYTDDSESQLSFKIEAKYDSKSNKENVTDNIMPFFPVAC